MILPQPGEVDAADTALMIQVLERLLNDDSFLDNEIKKEIKQYDNDGDYKIDREEFRVICLRLYGGDYTIDREEFRVICISLCDGDNKIDREEFRVICLRLCDGDNKIDR